MSPDRVKVTSRRTSQARESPTLELPHNHVLEIPRPNTLDGPEEAASRIFQDNDIENEKTGSSETSSLRVAFPNTAGSPQQRPDFDDGESFNEIQSLHHKSKPVMVVEGRAVRWEVDPSLYPSPSPPFRNRQDPPLCTTCLLTTDLSTRVRKSLAGICFRARSASCGSASSTLSIRCNHKSPISWLIARIVSS